MRDTGLTARMMIAGTVLFGFYAAMAAFLLQAFGSGALPFVLAGSLLFVGVQYKIGKWAALKSVGAVDLPEDDFRELHDRVERLADDMGIDKPRLMIAQMGTPNAFAVGRKGAGTVVISKELLHTLTVAELDGVLAHELAHIRNRDVVMMVLGQGVASMLAILAQWFVLLAGDNFIVDYFVSIVVGTLVQMLVMIFVMAIARYREYIADQDAADEVGGESLARALEKISQRSEQIEDNEIDSQVSALCIFGSDTGLLAKLFASHPPVEKRIERLRA
jgi:heat shock protein HtpX